MLDREFAVGGQRLDLQGLGGRYDEIFLPLDGEHQAGNAALALAAVEALFGAGAAAADRHRRRAGRVRRRRARPGRLERVASGAAAPTVLVDAAHNPHGARALAATLAAEFRFTRLVGVLGGDGATRTPAASSPSWSRCWPRWSSPPTRRRGRWTPTSWPRWRWRSSATTG